MNMTQHEIADFAKHWNKFYYCADIMKIFLTIQLYYNKTDSSIPYVK